MGKGRKVGRLPAGNGTICYVEKPRPKDEPCRPNVNVPVACLSCEAEALVTGLVLPHGCTLGIVFKFWTVMDFGCEVCHQRKPVRIFDCTQNVPVAKAFEILAKCELNCSHNLRGLADKLKSSHKESAELIHRVTVHINKLYNNVHVAKRPKDVIKAMTDDLRVLDFDPTINGKDMVIFRCTDGDLKISCNQVTLGHGNGK